MDPEVMKWLTIMGLQDQNLKHLKMKTLNSQMRKLALLKHPDKPGGKKEDFQELMNAYENLGKIIEETVPEDTKDHEEVIARKTFKDVNFTTENINSITINIETKMVKYWEKVLTEKLGEPIDRNKGQSGNNNGKQWVDGSLNLEMENKTAKVYITLWLKEKKEKSTMLIQAERSCHFLNISYVTNTLPKLFDEALLYFENDNPGLVAKKPGKNKSVKSPKIRTRTTKKAGNTPSCKVCVFAAKNVTELNDHMISTHKKKAIVYKTQQEVQDVTHTPFKPPTLSAVQLVEISIENEGIKTCRCYVCNKAFENYEDLSLHEKDEHEVPCTFCEQIFITNTDLRDHVIKEHVPIHNTVQKTVNAHDDDCSDKEDNSDEDTHKKESENIEDFVFESPSKTTASLEEDVEEVEEVNELKEAEKPQCTAVTEDEALIVKDSVEPDDKTNRSSRSDETIVTMDEKECELCNKNKNKVENIAILEAEHMKLKALYEKTRDAYYALADEKQELNYNV